MEGIAGLDQVIEPQVSVVVENEGVRDDASLAHWKGLAAVPNASKALGEQLSEVDEQILEPESLMGEESIDGEWVLGEESVSNRLAKNSRIKGCSRRSVVP